MSRCLPLLCLLCLSLTLPLAVTAGSINVDAGLSKAERFEQLKQIARLPLKGWNSWDSFLGSANEKVVRAHIDYIAEHLAPLGYRVVCMDAYWYESSSSFPLTYFDQWGRPQVDPVRYPSAMGQQGFKQLSAYAHSKGLLLGIHTMRGAHAQAVQLKLPVLGMPQYTIDQIIDPAGACVWWGDWYALNMSHPAAQAFYNSLYAQYAEWGLDYIKLDCSFAGNFILDNLIAISSAIDHSGREMLLSLSPGYNVEPEMVEAVKNFTNLYRVTDDTWDYWSRAMEDHVTPDVVQLFPFIGWPHGRYGLPSFPDLDMLPLGWIANPNDPPMTPPSHWSNLSKDEQVTMMSYWTMFRSPRLYGGDLQHPDAFSLSLLTNAEALSITDHSVHNAPVVANASVSIWRADSESWSSDGISYAAVFNLLNATARLSISVADVRQPAQPGTVCDVMDVWTAQQMGSRKTLDVTMRNHQSYLWKLSNCQ